MEIQTAPFKLNRKEYFLMLSRNYFQKRLWFYVIIYGFATLMTLKVIISRSAGPLYFFYISLVIIMPLYFLFWFWRYSGSKENAIFYRERTAKLTDEFLEIVLDDGSISKTRWENFLGYKKIKDGFILCISKQGFIYLPNRAFSDSNDAKKFEAFISTQLKEVK